MWNPSAKPLQETILDDTGKWREAIQKGGKVVTWSGLYTRKDMPRMMHHCYISLFSIAMQCSNWMQLVAFARWSPIWSHCQFCQVDFQWMLLSVVWLRPWIGWRLPSKPMSAKLSFLVGNTESRRNEVCSWNNALKTMFSSSVLWITNGTKRT